MTVAEQFLNRANVLAALEQVRRKRMPQRMCTDRLEDSRDMSRSLYRALDAILVQVMPPTLATARISGNVRGGKDPEPSPTFACPRIFTSECARQFDTGTPGSTIRAPQRARIRELLVQRRCQRRGQHGHPVLLALALANNNQAAIEIEIFDAQAQAFHLAHPCSIQELSNATCDARNRRQ